MNKYDYVAENIVIEELLRTPKGALRLDAKAAYKEGWAMLSVYAYWYDKVLAGKLLAGKPAMVQRIILHRMFVPRDTPKAEKNRMLRTMCDLFAVKHGTEYALRSKLK
jgi:hypothetical protein